LSFSPCVSLFGPPVQAVSLLRILGCICHHPVLLADFDVLGLPKELRPTRLIGQAGTRLDKGLGARSSRDLGIRRVNCGNLLPRLLFTSGRPI
jgi:hypothetical protein